MVRRNMPQDLEVLIGRPLGRATAGDPRFPDPETLADAIQAYFDKACEEHRPLNVESMCAFLGISRIGLHHYQTGKNGNDPEGYRRVLEHARSVIAGDKLERALKGEYNPAIAIFDLKNNHGYRDSAQLAMSVAPSDDQAQAQGAGPKCDVNLDTARRIAYMLAEAARVLEQGPEAVAEREANGFAMLEYDDDDDDNVTEESDQ